MARHSALDPAALAVLPLASILAAPYAFAYEMPITTGAVLTVIAASLPGSARFSRFNFPLLLGCIAAPSVIPGHHGAVAAAVSNTMAATLWILFKTPSRPDDPTGHPQGAIPRAQFPGRIPQGHSA